MWTMPSVVHRDITLFIEAVRAVGAVAALSAARANGMPIDRRRVRVAGALSEPSEQCYEDGVWYDVSGRRQS
jgi:hypothetical protein